ncbi:aldo/keto reductase [Candidatus Saccharibacteria bacterium]|nr:aldo/keto reductase [Candidatus Saccharibacteria bacterium]
MTSAPKIKLENGEKMPAVGFGTWRLSEGAEASEAVSDALQAGYRLIDTAKIYGNEMSVGQAVRGSGIPRGEIFVTTKLWNGDQGFDSAMSAFDNSLRRLGLEYVDLYLIHWPGHSSQKRRDSWRALEEINRDGRAKSIGVSNYEIEHLEELFLSAKTVPAVNQIEFNPYIYDKQVTVIEYCKKQKIAIEAYSPLARGRQIDNPKISGIAQKLDKTNAQVLLRWAIQHGTVPIPKSAHPGRIRENLEIFDFELSGKDVETLNSLGEGKSSLPFLVSLLK